jgi:putative ABC transport system permease protein
VQRTLRWLDVAQDARVSLRSLLRAPVLTSTILLTVGLGIGATTAMFGAIEAAFLRPLPYAEPQRLVWIYTDAPPFKWRFSAVDYLALESQQTQFERIAGFTNRSMTFTDGRAAHLLQGRAVSWTYFGTLGLAPALGRDFTHADSTTGAPPAVIVSHAFWQQRLDGRADAIGQSVTLDGVDHTLVGVLPRIAGPLEQRQDVFVAVQFRPPNRRGPFSYWMVGRLRPDTSAAAASEELRAINRRIFPIWQASYQDDKATWSLVDLKTRLVEGRQTAGALALVAVGLVWLIACVNASNLLLARVTSRQRELAVRAALGASRARLVRFLLVESSLLAAGSAVIAAGVTWLGLGLLRSAGSVYLPRTQEITVNGPVTAAFAAAVLVSLVLFGAIPAMHATIGRIDQRLRSGGRSASGNPSARRLRHVLVAAQFAIATPLLVVAALLLVSLDALERVDLGFDPRGIVTGSLRLPPALYQDRGRVANYWDELSRRLAALPGVSSVAFADSLPPSGASNINNFDLEDAPTPPGQSQPSTPWVAVTPDYFRTLSISLLEGRLLDERDAQAEYLDAVLVDRAWASRFFPGRSALGKRFKEGGCSQCPWTTVVGVVSDVRYVGLDATNHGTVYTPLPGGIVRSVVLRTQGDAAAAMGSMGQVVQALDPAVALTAVATADDLVAQALESPASLSLLVSTFASVAAVLAALGIFGVMAYYVQENTKDIGIRRALGGSAAHVLRLVAGQGMAVVLGGIAVGLPLAYLVSRSLSTLLFNVGAGEIAAYAAVTAFLLSVALAACVIPARRALALPPSVVLRSE